MRLDRFFGKYAVTEKPEGFWVSDAETDNGTLGPLISHYGGTAFNRGIYRLHTWTGIDLWSGTVGRAFPALDRQVVIFGQDWQGNQFGWRNVGDPKVLLFQIGSGEVFEIADSIASFHDQELVEHSAEALNERLWHAWVALGGDLPNADQCVGYRIPIYLGGRDQLENLELCDLQVYWGINAQLLQQVRALPPGTPISEVRIVRNPTGS